MDWITQLGLIASIASIVGLIITGYQVRQGKEGKYTRALFCAFQILIIIIIVNSFSFFPLRYRVVDTVVIFFFIFVLNFEAKINTAYRVLINHLRIIGMYVHPRLAIYAPSFIILALEIVGLYILYYFYKIGLFNFLSDTDELKITIYIIIFLIITTFIEYFLNKHKYKHIELIIRQLPNLKTYASNLIRLWFDWIKWLVLAGAITIVAARTQSNMLFFIKNVSYIIILIYILINVFTLLNKFSDFMLIKLNYQTYPTFGKEHTAILKLYLFVIIGLILTVIILNWNSLLENMVTKLPN
ncbi:MAG TPA: hypothetical protein PKK68_02595 [Methanothrix soehngenii]|nr:hypothetical protein [Methanothrix soehngenii]